MERETCENENDFFNFRHGGALRQWDMSQERRKSNDGAAPFYFEEKFVLQTTTEDVVTQEDE